VSKMRQYLNQLKRKMKYPNVEFDLFPYREWLDAVNAYDMMLLYHIITKKKDRKQQRQTE
jgi:hypothetical protein